VCDCRAAAAALDVDGAGGALFPNYDMPDGMSMVGGGEAVGLSTPTVLLCQQPVSVLEDPEVVPGAFVHTSTPALQVRCALPCDAMRVAVSRLHTLCGAHVRVRVVRVCGR
jgi:hypothetical protein